MDHFSFIGMFQSSGSDDTIFREQFHGHALDEDHKYRLIAILDIDPNISSIPDGFFCGSPNLKEVNLPVSLCRIGKFSFADCPNLCRVNFPINLKELDDSAFDGCSSLIDVLTDGSYGEFPQNVKYIGKAAFRNTAIEYIDLGFNNWIIGDHAFSGCKAPTSVGLYHDVRSIGEYAFEGCTSLVDVEIYDSVSYLPITAFHNCIALVPENIPKPRIPANFPDPGPLMYSLVDGRMKPNLCDSIRCAISMAPFLDFVEEMRLCLDFPHYFFQVTMDYFRIEAWNGICKVYSWKEVSGKEFDYIRTLDLYNILTGKISI